MRTVPDFCCFFIKGSEDECWLWKGYVKKSVGYGEYCHELAHRIAYRKTMGEIPEGKHIHHLCNNKLCVNPKHLVCLSPREHFDAGVCGEHKKKSRLELLKIVKTVYQILAKGENQNAETHGK